MRPKQQKPIAQDDLFRSRLEQIINMRHELLRLADEIDWPWIDAQVSGIFGSEASPIFDGSWESSFHRSRVISTTSRRVISKTKAIRLWNWPMR